MSLKDRIHELESQLVDERELEIRKICEEYGERVRTGAVGLVENAIKYKKYEIKTTGFFKSKKIIKSVTGHTEPIKIYSNYPAITPTRTYSDGDSWYVVGNRREFDLLIDSIKKKLEQEGFECWVGESNGYIKGPVIYYTMKWE